MSCNLGVLADGQAVIDSGADLLNTIGQFTVPTGTYQIRFVAFDALGRIVGVSVQNPNFNTYVYTDGDSWNYIKFKEDDYFSIGDFYTLYVITKSFSSGRWVYRKYQCFFGEEEYTTNLLGVEGTVIDYIIGDTQIDGESAGFGDVNNTCPFVVTQDLLYNIYNTYADAPDDLMSVYDTYEDAPDDLLSAYEAIDQDLSSEKTCAIPVFDWVVPAFEAASLASPPSDPNDGYAFGVNPSSDLVCTFQPANISYIPLVDYPQDSVFYFGVDANGLIRMSGMPPTANLVVSFGSMFGYVFGVETPAFNFGDTVFLYLVKGNDMFAISSDSIGGDSGFEFTFQSGSNYFNDASIHNVKDNPDLCPSRLKLSIWGWLDEMSEDLSQIPTLQGEVDSLTTEVTNYEEQIGGYSAQDEWFNTNYDAINEDILAMANALGYTNEEAATNYGWDAPIPIVQDVDEEF